MYNVEKTTLADRSETFSVKRTWIVEPFEENPVKLKEVSFTK
jgi:hypothetical protein